MNIIFAIISFTTLFIIPYKLVGEQFHQSCQELKDIHYNFYSFIQSKEGYKKIFPLIIYILFIIILIPILVIYFLYFICYLVIKNASLQNYRYLYKYIFFPYILTYLLTQFTTTYDNPSFRIVNYYFESFNIIFEQKYLIEFVIYIIVTFLISFLLQKVSKLFDETQKKLIEFLNVLFTSTMFTLIILACLGIFYILTDNVAETLDVNHISTFDVYAILAIHYGGCNLASNIIYLFCIKPFIERGEVT